MRERKEDIPLLADFFLQRSNKNVSFADNVFSELTNYPWSGNVRELQTWVGRMCRYFKDEHVEWENIPENYRPDSPNNITGEDSHYPEYPINYNEYKDQLRMRALELSKGNSAEADRLLGLKVGTMKQWKFQRKNRSE